MLLCNPMSFRALSRCSLLSVCFLLFAGCGQQDEHAGKSASPVVQPARIPPVDEAAALAAEKNLAEDIAAHQQEVADLRKTIEARPAEERNRIVVNDQSYLCPDYDRDKRKFLQLLVEGYRQGTKDQGATQELCVEFLNRYTNADLCLPDAHWDQVRALLPDVQKSGTQDPLVQAYLLGMEQDLSAKDRLNRLNPLIDGVDAGRYAALSKYYLKKWRTQLERQVGSQVGMNMRFRECGLALGKAAEESREDKLAQRFLYEEYMKLIDEERIDDHERVYKSMITGNQSLWLKHVIAAEYFIDLGWHYRGSSFADTVTEEGWQKFGENLARAAPHALRAWQLEPGFPEGPLHMIVIAGAGTDGWSLWDWFYRSTDGQPDHLGIYKSMRHFLRTRWRGSNEELARLTEECIATGRFDTRIPWTALDTYQIMVEDESPNFSLRSVKGIDSQLKALTAAALQKDFEKDCCSAMTPDRLSRLFAFCVHDEQFQLARQLHEKLGDHFVSSSTRIENLPPSYVVGKVYAFTGPASEELQAQLALKRDTFLREHYPARFTAMLEVIDEARKKDSNPLAETYFAQVEQLLRQLKGYYSGEWVDLPLAADSAGWDINAPEWNVNEGKLTLKSPKGPRAAYAMPLPRFEPPYVVEAEFESDPSSTAYQFYGLTYGELVGARYGDLERWFIGIVPSAPAIMFRKASSTGPFLGRPIPKGNIQRMRAFSWTERCYVTIGQHWVLNMNEKEFIPEPRFKLGLPYKSSDSPGGQVTISNVRIHRVPKYPGDDATDAKEAEFCAKLLEIAPDDESVLTLNASYAYDHKQYEKTLKDSQAGLRINPDSDNLFVLTACALHELGRDAEAAKAFEKALNLNPSSIFALDRIAFFLATCPDDTIRNGNQALQIAQMGANDPSSYQYRFIRNMALAQAELGDFEQAKKSLARARQIFEQTDEKQEQSVLEQFDKIAAVLNDNRPYRDVPETISQPPKP
ncbi:tetratricopeptide repeat protein [Planctomicrobium piriforme]|uniref:Tetratricopeptide repeat-containing protein n=1 Tax=Planctomicrobium piriforme TaxID=1576369 RepID=A0A1I3BEC2_9PLAN|nr:hypothetical protein [Planctomicrobium piriforme]SFH60618.1 hypothetical protein SAMN05421753_101410 [Planctomicrobium piriforme]